MTRAVPSRQGGSVLSMILAALLLITESNGQMVNLKVGEACAASCSGQSKILKFDEGKVYTYEISTKHSLDNPNSDKEKIELSLTGKAELTKLSGCDFGLKLKDISYTESLLKDGAATKSKDYAMFKEMVEKMPIRFGYDDGRVTGVCQENNDNEFAVNVKKGVISALQLSMDSLDTPNYLTETDIAGECFTDYSTSSDSPNFVKIKKVKSVAGCARKTKYFSSINGKIFEKPTEGRNVAMLDSQHECNILVKRTEGIKEVSCEETHEFKPMSSDVAGSSLEVTHQLKFLSVRDEKMKFNAPTVRTDLAMNHGDANPLFMSMTAAASAEDATGIITALCEGLVADSGSVSGQTTTQFVRLIRVLSQHNLEQITALGTQIQTDTACTTVKDRVKSIFLDALSNTKTEDALKYILKEPKTAKNNGVIFSMIQNPTSTMIKDVSIMLDSSRTAFQMLGSMVNSYCSQKSGCMRNPDVVMAMDKLRTFLGEDCATTKTTDQKNVMYALRALRNAGDSPDLDKLTENLLACVNRNTNTNFIKVLAVEAVRQFPCNIKTDTFLWKIFNDISYTSELRIQAYLGLVRCPTKTTFRKIISLLEKEQSQQVGSFIWSHIANLMETSDRFKDNIRESIQIFSEAMGKLGRQFNLDFRSYSKNYEKAYQSGYVSARVDANVIFTQTSPLPTSMTTNVTFDFYGRSVNFMELGLRSEGFFDQFMTDSDFGKPHKDFHPDVLKMDQKISETSPKSPSMSLYTKLMGQEVLYTSNLAEDFMMIAASMSSGFHKERSLLLLDSVMSMATVSGFPLEVSIEAGVVGQLYLQPNSVFKTSHFQLNVKANAAIKVVGKLQLNGHCTRIGVQSEGDVSTDAQFGAEVKRTISKNEDNIESSDFSFNIIQVPDDRKLLVVKNKLAMVHGLGAEAAEAQATLKKTVDRCTSDGLQKLLGVKVCAQLSVADQKYSSLLPNMDAQIQLVQFKGLKVNVKKDTNLEMPTLPKLKQFRASVAFQDATEDIFRIDINRDNKIPKHSFELLLWKKNVYFNVEVNKQLVEGKFIFGKMDGQISGKLEYEGILKTILAMELKGNFDTITMYFEQLFSKAGPQIIMRLKREGDNAFSINSRTDLKIPSHKVYNYFQRYRHETKMSLPGKNDMSFVLEYSLGNKPAIEIKSNLDVYWKTNDKVNFLVNENFRWLKQSSKMPDFHMVEGTNYTVEMNQKIQVKDKNFNIKNSGYFFVSNNVFSFLQNPALVEVGFKQNDLVKNEERMITNTRVGIMYNGLTAGSVQFSNRLSYPSMFPTKSVLVSGDWNQTTAKGKFSARGRVATRGQTVLEATHSSEAGQRYDTWVQLSKLEGGGTKYSVRSVLELPSSHLLTVMHPDGVISVRTAVSADTSVSGDPMVVGLQHTVKLDDKETYRGSSSLRFNYALRSLELASEMKDVEENKPQYTLKLASYLRREASSIDTGLTVKIGIAALSIKTNTFKMQQSVDWSQMRMKSSAGFGKPLQHGYSIEYDGREKVPASEQLATRFKAVVTVNSKEEKIATRLSWLNLIELEMESQKLLFVQLLARMSKIKPQMITRQVSFKTLPGCSFSYYYKTNSKLVMRPGALEYTITGRNGDNEASSIPLSGSMRFVYNVDNWKKVDLAVNMDHPLLRSRLAVASAGISASYEVGLSTLTSDGGVRWQKVGEPAAKKAQASLSCHFRPGFRSANASIIYGAGKPLFQATFLSNTETPDGISVSVSLAAGAVPDRYSGSADMEVQLNRKQRRLFVETKITTSLDAMEKAHLRVNASVAATGQNVYLLSMQSNGVQRQLLVDAVHRFVGNNFVDNIRWTANELGPLQSGTAVLGYLLEPSGALSITGNVHHGSDHRINFKWTHSDTSLNASFSSNIAKPVKLAANYELSLPSNSLTAALDISAADFFFRIPRIGVTWTPSTAIQRKSSVVFRVESSVASISSWEYLLNNSYDSRNKYSTMRTLSVFNSKGVEKARLDIDMAAGKFFYFFGMGKMLSKDFADEFKFDLTYRFTAMTNHALDLKVIGDKPLLVISWDYFRQKTAADGVRKVDKLGDAVFYGKFMYRRGSSSVDVLLFVDKSLTSGKIRIDAKVEMVKLDITNFWVHVSEMKNAGGGKKYIGKAMIDKNEYSATLTSRSELQKALVLESKQSEAKLRKLELEVDMVDKLLLRFSVNEESSLFLIQIAQTQGVLKAVYRGNSWIDLALTRTVTVPDSSKTVIANIKAYLRGETGYTAAYTIVGTISGSRKLNLRISLSRVASKQFPGGKDGMAELKVSLDDVLMSCLLAMDRKETTFVFRNDVDYTVSGTTVVAWNHTSLYRSKEDMRYDETWNLGGKMGAMRVQRTSSVFEALYQATEFEVSTKYDMMKETVYGRLKLDADRDYKVSTNLLRLIKTKAANSVYFVNAMDYETSFSFNDNYDVDLKVVVPGYKKPVTISIKNVYNNAKKYALFVSGESDFEQMKFLNFDVIFLSKTDPKESEDTSHTVSSKLFVNKKKVYEVSTDLKSFERKKFVVKGNFDGSYYIDYDVSLDLKMPQFKHMIETKDGMYKRLLWKSESLFETISGVEVFLMHQNDARDCKIGYKRMSSDMGDSTSMELTWNKKKQQTLSLEFKKNETEKSVTLITPLRTFTLTKTKNPKQSCMISIKKHQSSADEAFFVKVMYDLKGDLMAQYDLTLNVHSSMLKKKVTVKMQRTLEENNKLYSFTLDANFEGNGKPFFSVNGYLRKLTSKAFEAKVDIKNNEKLLTLFTTVILSREEVKIHYKVEQTGKDTKECLLQIIPFKKLEMTNNADMRLLVSRVNYQNGFNSEFVLKLDEAGPNIEASSSYSRNPMKYYAVLTSNEKKLVVHIRPVGTNMVLGEIYRKVDGKKLLDASLNVKRNEDSIVTSKLYWNPEIFDKYNGFLQELYKPERIRSIVIRSYEASENRFSGVVSGLKMSLLENVNAVNGLDTLTSLVNDAEQLPATVLAVYDNDDFYMSQALNKVGDLVDSLKLSGSVNRFRNMCERSMSKLNNKLYDLFVEAKIYETIYPSIKTYMQFYTSDQLQPLMEKLDDAIQVCLKKSKELVNRVADGLGAISDNIQGLQIIVGSGYNNVADMVKQTKLYEMIQLMREIRSQIIEAISKVIDTSIIQERYKLVEDSVKNIKDAAEVIMQLREQVRGYLRSTSFVSSLMNTLDLLRSLSYRKVVLDLIQPDKASFKADLTKVTFTMQFYMSPLFRPTMRLARATYSWIPKQAISQISQSGIRNKLLDLFYRYENVFFKYNSIGYLRSLLPPFDQTAYIMNGNSIVTFDGSTIRIGSGECKHMLARNTKTKSFSLTMTVNEKEKIYTLYYTMKIAISSVGGKVTVDDKEVKSLPKTVTDNGLTIVIYRDEDKIKVTTTSGLTLSYFPELDVLQFKVAGRWHGKLKGLFGSNDIDRVNDWATPIGRITHDAGVLVNGWSIGECKSNTKTGMYARRVNIKQLQTCSDMFSRDSTSYLSRCFSLVDPKPYEKMCSQSLQYSDLNEADFKQMVCSYSRNLISRCNQAGRQIRLCKSCITCDNKNKFDNLLSSLNLKQIVLYNYVFIVGQSDCALKYFDFVNRLAKALAVRPKTTFTLLTFNGNQMSGKAHLRMYEGNARVTADQLKELLTKVSKEENTNSDSTSGISAIGKALKMRGRRDTLDRIIVVSCSTCTPNSDYRYSVLASMLTKRGVSVTYLSGQAFSGAQATADSAAVTPSDSLFFNSAAANQNIVQKQLPANQMQPVSDSCSALALLDNGGSVWSMENIITGEKEARMRRASDKITEMLDKKVGPRGMDKGKLRCYCRANKLDFGQPDCTVN